MKTIVTFINELRGSCGHGHQVVGLCRSCEEELADRLQHVVLMLEKREALDQEITRLRTLEITLIEAMKENQG